MNQTQNNSNQTKVDPVSYNLSGLRPNLCEWNIQPETLVARAKEVATSIFGNDVFDVILEHDDRNGDISMTLWLKSNSKHLVDNSTQGSMINTSIKRLSNEVENFLKSYGFNPINDIGVHPKKKLRVEDLVVKNTSKDYTGEPVTGLYLSWTAFVRLEFDEEGTVFRDKTKTQKTPKMIVTAQAHYSSRNHNIAFPKLLYITVKKAIKGAKQRVDKPTAAFNSRPR